MSKKKPAANSEPVTVIDEVQKKTEQDQIGSAFDNADPIPPLNPKDPALDAPAPLELEPEVVDPNAPKRFVDEPKREDERIFPRVLNLPFTVEDKAKKADAISKKIIELQELEAEKKETNEDFNERIKGLEREIIAIGVNIAQGGEDKQVDCTQRFDYEKGRAITFRIDNQEIIEDRALQKNETQTKMALAPGEGIPGAWSKSDMEPRGKSGLNVPSEAEAELNRPDKEDGEDSDEDDLPFNNEEPPGESPASWKADLP